MTQTIAKMEETLAAQRAAFAAELPVSLAVRKDRLVRLATMMADNADRFVSAVSQDFGHRSREQSMATDIVGSVMAVTYALKHFESWVKPEKRALALPLRLMGSRAWIEYQPKGVVGVIAPWNFPIQLAIAPVAGAFAAGNRAMAKISEATPGVAAAFEEIVPLYFDRLEFAVFSGGPEIGERFAGLAFDHLVFTGGGAIARHVMRAAAENLVPVTLELGGKSPTIIGRSADVAKATDRIALGKMMNAGQICLAPDYALVPEEKEGAFVDGMRDAVTRMFPTLLANDDYTSVINERQHVRLSGYLDDARAKGARIVEINPGNEDFGATNSNKMPLNIILDATDDMKVMQEEIFGPIFPVRRYGRIEEAIDYVNARNRPLGLYYFGKDESEKRQVLDRTISGGVTLDDVIFHAAEELPFGGIGPAGMGSYHGIDGFRTFSHAKAVYQQTKVDIAKLAGFKPPFNKTTHATIERALKPWRSKSEGKARP
jgi:coniferyl-aldehyde dehydrogenase